MRANRRRCSVFIAAFPFLLLFPGAACLASRVGAQSGGVEPPSISLSDSDKARSKMASSLFGLHGEFGYSILHKTIDVTWFYRAGANEPRNDLQSYAVAFWPTEVASFGEDTILVAGKDTLDGNIRVERWKFSMPSAMPHPYIDSATGEVVYPKIDVQPFRKAVVFRGDSRGPVRLVLQRHGQADTAFVQFDDERDLFSLDVTTGALTKVLSIAPDGSIPVQPALQETSGGRWSRKHVVEGYTYCLGGIGDQGAGLFLFDSDLDGDIDEHGPLTWSEFWGRELDRTEKYEEFY